MATGDLTTLTSVREFMQFQATETVQDSILANLITRASAAITNYTGREFVDSGAGPTRTFVYQGAGILDLAPYDAQTVTQVQVDAQTPNPVTVVANFDYFVRPKPNPTGTFTWLLLPTQIRLVESEVNITGTWGFPSIPADVEDACIKTVTLWARREVSAFSTVFNPEEASLERPEGLPVHARRMLDAYRRVKVA